MELKRCYMGYRGAGVMSLLSLETSVKELKRSLARHLAVGVARHTLLDARW